MKTIEDVLGGLELGRGLRPEHRALMAGCGKNVHFAPSSYLLREGDPADTFFVLREGDVALEVHSPERGAITVQTVHGGEILGWSWLFPPYRTTFDARALTDVRAIAFDGACLRGKCDQDHELGYQLMRAMAQVFTRRLGATRLQLLDLYGQR